MRLAIQIAAVALVLFVVTIGRTALAQNDSGWKKSNGATRYALGESTTAGAADVAAAPNAAVTPTPNPRSWRNTLVRQYGSPEENPVFWRSISANSYVGEISGPIQLHHGTADEDVPLVFSELLFNEMLNANQYAELYTYEGDNHNISNYFSTAMQRTIEFFDRFVKQAG